MDSTVETGRRKKKKAEREQEVVRPTPGGIAEKDLWALIAASSSRPSNTPTNSSVGLADEPSAEESLRRRRTLHELNVAFNSMAVAKGRPRRRPVETESSRAARMELLYDSVIHIFEMQLQLERREAEESKRRGSTSLAWSSSSGSGSGNSGAPALLPLKAESKEGKGGGSLFRLPKMPSLFSSATPPQR